MHGVTAALVAFLFVCVVFPNLIRNRPQYYAGFGLVCLIIFCDAIAYATSPGRFAVVMYFLNALFQIGAICVLFLSAGGITWRDLGGEMLHAFEVIRRGEDQKEVIVPLRGEQPKRKEDAEAPPERIPLDEVEPQRPAPPVDETGTRPPEDQAGAPPRV